MKKRLSLKQFLVTLSDACLCESNKIQDSNAEIKNGTVCPEDDSISEEKAITGRRRIKVLITRRQLDCLMAKKISVEELVFVNQRLCFRYFDDDKWKPGLESIHETPEL